MYKKDIIALSLTGAAFILSLVSLWRTHLLARHQSRTALTIDQIKWAERVLDIFGDIDQLYFRCNNNFSIGEDIVYKKDLSNIATRFSIETDKGRFLFPNYLTGHGSHKPEAYQGLRGTALELLIEVHNQLLHDLKKSTGRLNLSRDHYIDLKRRFVSDVQRLSRVRWRIKFAGGA